MIKVHQVIDGPYEYPEYFTLVCLIEEDGEVYEDEVPFETFNEAYKFMSKMERSTEPLFLPVNQLYVPN